MPIEVYKTAEFAHDTKRRTVILDTNRFHAWIHYYKPGQIDEMHCHNQDQTFTIIEGICTMNFPDGGEAKLDAGMIWINSENVRHLPSPFGGMKASGVGRDGGDYSFDFYMETKNICVATTNHRVPRMGLAE